MESLSEENNLERKSKLIFSFLFPLMFSLIMWISKIWEVIFKQSFAEFGIFPRTVKGLIGIITSPFIHADFLHLISNTVPIVILGAALIYFYKSLAFRVFTLIFILTGTWVWLAGRPSFHIGASGIVYGLAFFLFLSGIFRRDRGLMAFSLLIVFLYGSIIWGVLPIETGMSWEGHLFGALSGIICAIAFKNEGPQRKKYEWEEEEEEDNNDEKDNTGENTSSTPLNINYNYIEKKPGDLPDDK